MALTDKQKLFADEYLIDLNATSVYKVVYKNCIIMKQRTEIIQGEYSCARKPMFR